MKWQIIPEIELTSFTLNL